MRFRTTPKDFRLWIMDLHATMKRNSVTLPQISKARIRVDHQGLHAMATDRYIIVDSVLKSDIPDGLTIKDFHDAKPGLVSFKEWDVLKNFAASVHGVGFTNEGLEIFTDKSFTFGERFDTATASFTVPFDSEADSHRFPNLDQLIETARKNNREVSESGRDGFRMELVKHIKGVMIEPRSIGFGKPGFIHTQPPRATGIIMPVRIGLEG